MKSRFTKLQSKSLSQNKLNLKQKLLKTELLWEKVLKKSKETQYRKLTYTCYMLLLTHQWQTPLFVSYSLHFTSWPFGQDHTYDFHISFPNQNSTYFKTVYWANEIVQWTEACVCWPNYLSPTRWPERMTPQSCSPTAIYRPQHTCACINRHKIVNT